MRGLRGSIHLIHPMETGKESGITERGHKMEENEGLRSESEARKILIIQGRKNIFKKKNHRGLSD